MAGVLGAGLSRVWRVPPTRKIRGTYRNTSCYMFTLKFKHKGLRLLYEDGNHMLVNTEHVEKLRNILARLEIATSSDDMSLPGFKLHQLKGQRAGTWSVTVRANWRVTFRFEGAAAVDIDYEDYH